MEENNGHIVGELLEHRIDTDSHNVEQVDVGVGVAMNSFSTVRVLSIMPGEAVEVALGQRREAIFDIQVEDAVAWGDNDRLRGIPYPPTTVINTPTTGEMESGLSF